MADNQNPWLGYSLDNHIIFLISNAVFGILQLFMSLEPIDQFQCQWGFLQNVAVKMVHTVIWKNEN